MADKMIEELADVVKARVLWAVIPCRAALGIDERRMAEIVTWAAENVSVDVRAIVERYLHDDERRAQ
jgi:hypothetical protein